MVADITLHGAERRVFAKLKKYLADHNYTNGQKIEMLHDIERNIDVA
jgi:hypothetical protein